MTKKCPKIGIVGCFQNGKSTMANCLLDDRIAATGRGIATTRCLTVFTRGEFKQVNGFGKDDSGKGHPLAFEDYLANREPQAWEYLSVSLWKPLLENVDIVDTPGFDADDADDRIAIKSLEELDFAVLVVRNKGLSLIEEGILRAIAKRELPFAVVMNCTESMGSLWDPSSEANGRICREIEARLRNVGHIPHPIDGKFVWPVNLAWFWYAGGHPIPKNGEEERRLARATELHFKIRRADRLYSANRIAGASNFLPLRRHLQIVAKHFGIERRSEGKRALALIEESWSEWDRYSKDTAMSYGGWACYVAPGFQPALRNWAALCLARKEHEEAVHVATRALDIDGRDIDTLFLRAEAYFGLKNFHEARFDLLRMIQFLEGEWQVAWGNEGRATRSNKLIKAYLMKIKCDCMEGNLQAALSSLCTLSNSDEQPLDYGNDESLKITVWCLSAGVEYSRGDYRLAILCLTKALPLISEEMRASSELAELCAHFELNATGCPLGGSGSLGMELQRILWEACFKGFENIEDAVSAFINSNTLPLYEATWQDEPRIVPHFISIMGKLSNTDWEMNDLVERYFLMTTDEGLGEFINIAQRGLTDKQLQAFRKAVSLKASVPRPELFSNTVSLTNWGNPTISDITVNISYKLDGVMVFKTLSRSLALPKYETHEWPSVLEGKGLWGSGKYLTEFKVRSASSRQGEIKLI